MPDRYWVGGTAAWDGTAGSKWALTSGGAGGESVPTTADDVFFDASSTGTVTISAGNTGAKSINCTGFTGTITGTAAITVAGSITLVAGQTYTHTGTVTLTGTGTLTTAGKTFSVLIIDGSNITVTLGDALNMAQRNIVVTSGNFNTADFSVSCGRLVSSNSNVRSITLGSSTVTLISPTDPQRLLDFATSTNLTFNAGTSSIVLNTTYPILSGGGNTFHNVSFPQSTTATTNPRVIEGSNTFNNLTFSCSSGDGLHRINLQQNQTVNGTLTINGFSPVARAYFRSDTIATTRVISANAVVSTDCDFSDITITGSGVNNAVTRAGNAGNNSGIAFPAAKTVYRVGDQISWGGSSSWALSSNGTGSNNNFPLAQDTAVIDNIAAPVGGSIAVSTYNLSTVNASSRTSAITFSHAVATSLYGSYTLGSGVTVSGTSAQTFLGGNTQTVTSAGKTITFPIIVNKPAGAFELGDAYSASNTITHTSGTFDAKNYNVTCTTFASNNSNTRTLTLGSGLWTLSGTGTVWNLATITNLTFNKDTANILLSNTTTTARTFAGGGLSYNKLTIGGATGVSTLTITGTNTFSELASTKTVAHTITFPNVTTTVGAWTISGTSGNLVTIRRTGASGTWSIAKTGGGVVDANFLSISNSTATPSDTWYAGSNSTNGGNNTGWIFTAPPAPATATGNMFMLF
jgi:hypothetical protein